MQGFLDGTDEECLLHHLDMIETFVQSVKTEPDTNEPDEQDEPISNEDSQIDAEKTAVHEEEIRNIYVSLAHDLREIYLLLFDCKHNICTFKYCHKRQNPSTPISPMGQMEAELRPPRRKVTRKNEKRL